MKEALFALAMLAGVAALAEPTPPERGQLAGVDGVPLSFAVFPPAAAERDAVIVRVLGRGTTFLQDDELVADLTGAGFRVFSYDPRGQGLSGRLLKDQPEIGHVERFADYVTDLRTFLDTVVETRAPGRPRYVIATSTGALVTLLAMTDPQPPRIDRVVLNVPLVRIQFLGLPHWAMKLVLAPFPANGPAPFRDATYVRPPFEGNDVTSDEKRFAKFHDVYDKYPETRLGPPSTRWVKEAIDASALLAERLEKGHPKTPSLLISALADTIVDPAAQIELSNLLGEPCTLSEFDGSRHGALIETDDIRDGVVASILRFLNAP